MEMKRGDVVICAAPGDYGKPRPAVVVQSDLFNGSHSSVVVCLITSHLEDAPLFRIPLPAGKTTGLKLESQVMVDKILAVPRVKCGPVIGRIDPASIEAVLITHMHFDHVSNLLTDDGKRAFPNATVRMAKAEYDYWLERA